jgi:DNA-binding CsgD family transcriptional regulator
VLVRGKERRQVGAMGAVDAFGDADERAGLVVALSHALPLARTMGADGLLELVRWVESRTGIDTSALAVTDDLDRLRLTARERDVLCRLVAGRSNKEIGVDLGIAEKTAEVHVSSVFRKLGVTNRVEAATIGVRLGVGDAGRVDRPAALDAPAA